MRHEKKLLAIPMPECPAGLEQMENKQLDRYTRMNYIRYSATIHVVDGEAVLAVTVFKHNGRPQHRFWQAGEQYGLDVYDNEFWQYNHLREHGKMYEAAIDSVYTDVGGRWYSTEKSVFYALPEEADAVLRFLGKEKEPREQAIELLAEKQRADRRGKIERRNEKARNALRAAFEGVERGATQDFKQWCENVPLKEYRYFFYDYTGRKEQSGVCSYCETRSTLRDIRERTYGVCPACDSVVTFWSAKRFFNSNGLRHDGRAALCQIARDRVVVRYFDIGISIKGGPAGIRKQVWAHEVTRSFLDIETGVELERYGEPSATTAVSVDGLCKYNCLSDVGECALCPENVADIRTRMKLYAPLEELAARGTEVNPIKMWSRAAIRLQVEYLIKMGMFRLAADELNDGYGKKSALQPGKNVVEQLGVPKDVVQRLRRIDPTPRALRVIRSLLKCGFRLTEEDMMDINGMYIPYGHAQTLARMARSASIHKVLKYLRKQTTIAHTSAEHMLQTWNDYMGMAEEVGKSTEDLHVVFPKTLKAAHDETAKMLRMKKNQELSKKVAKTGKKLADLYWKWDGLLIRPAMSHEELFREGEKLNHCVGRMNYAEKMAEFRTAIFFIRNAKEPDVPFVTLELDLKKWEKIQCYGKGDTYSGKQVDRFVQKWIKDVVKPARSADKTKEGHVA